MLLRWIVMFSFSLGAAGCLPGGGDDDGGDSAPDGLHTVTGDVVDFQTNMPIASGASVATSGLSPAPRTTAEGATFTIEDVPASSAFQILAAAPPTHRATFSESVVVENDDVSGVHATVVSEEFLGQLATGFQISPTAARGVLLAQVVDDSGTPKAGVGAANFAIAGVDGPHFLDADLKPAPNLTATSASGWVVFFEVAPGVVELAQAATATVSLEMPISPVNAGAVTVAKIKAGAAAGMLPTNVLFATQVFPIFSKRGCQACHSGNGPGKDLGGLTLDGSANLAYRELVQEDPTRVVKAMPETSLVLTMPSREDPPDRHPNVTFTSAVDPDYLTILVWIREGAKNN
ncbi:MAG: hypothetical protein HOV81_09745 [Kofleriaceae bacterium]|nr:hypothetical protein [Kofleriaceae bacterium]